MAQFSASSLFTNIFIKKNCSSTYLVLRRKKVVVTDNIQVESIMDGINKS